MTYPGSTGLSSGKSNISGYNLKQIPNFTPEQMQLFQQLLGGVQGGGGVGGGLNYLSRLASGNQQGFEQEEAPAYEAYNRALGSAANRFAGQGALNSSAFQNLASGGAQELGMNLAARRGELQRSAIEKLLGFSSDLLGQRPYENVLQEKKQSPWGGILGGIGGGLLGSLLGPAGATAGASIGSSLFGGK